MESYDSYALETSESLAEFLQSEFLRRLKRNAQYSQRAFARDLKLSSARLSEFLNGKRGISQQSLTAISASLKIRKPHQSIMNDLYFIQSAKSEKIKVLARARLQSLREKNKVLRLHKENFRVISEWYHSAILELTVLPDFQNNPVWIAKRLGVTATQAETAVKRLLELKLLSENNGILKATEDLNLTESESACKAIQQYHGDLLKKAELSLNEDSIAAREFNSMILAVPKDFLPEFRKAAQSFLQDFWKQVKADPKSELYAINIQCFPVTKSVCQNDTIRTSEDV